MVDPGVRPQASKISGHLLVRLRAVTAERKFEACSLVEGRWPAQAADADWPRSERGCCRLFPSDGGPRRRLSGRLRRCYRELGEVREQLELILERPLWVSWTPGALWGYLVRLPVTGSLHGPELVARQLGGGPKESPGQNRAWHLGCHLGCHWELGSFRLGVGAPRAGR